MNRRIEIPEENLKTLAQTLDAMDEALRVCSRNGQDRAMVVVTIFEKEVAVELVPIRKVLRSGRVKESRVLVWSVDGRPTSDDYVTTLVFRPTTNGSVQ